MSETIHVAYAFSNKNGWKSYRAVAVVTREGWRGYNGRWLAVDDTSTAAEERVIQYARETYAREGLEPPATVVRHGRKAGVVVDNVMFIGQTS